MQGELWYAPVLEYELVTVYFIPDTEHTELSKPDHVVHWPHLTWCAICPTNWPVTISNINTDRTTSTYGRTNPLPGWRLY